MKREPELTVYGNLALYQSKRLLLQNSLNFVLLSGV